MYCMVPAPNCRRLASEHLAAKDADIILMSCWETKPELKQLNGHKHKPK